LTPVTPLVIIWHDQPRQSKVGVTEAESYWQPVPANGFVAVHVSRHCHQTVNPFESGIQEVAPGCFVREHAHEPHEELILVMEGEGVALVDDEEHI
jgi:quercetin dioxygenase-like cupin family protein